MSCTSITVKGQRCKNKAKTDNLCTIHYEKELSKRREEDLKKYMSKHAEIEQLLKKQYNDILQILFEAGINKSLVTLILEYRLDIFADDSNWIYSAWNYGYMTFDVKGCIVECKCSYCMSTEDCCLKGICDHRRKNYTNHHCVYCECRNCVCLCASLHEPDIIKPIDIPHPDNPCEGHCQSCKNHGIVNYW